jgi:hypothetical protein
MSSKVLGEGGYPTGYPFFVVLTCQFDHEMGQDPIKILLAN